nr:putative Gag-polypeptide of LTR copia-type [Tanacetum cinerariifolium]
MVEGDKPSKDKDRTENYKVWVAAIQLALHTRNKLGFINGKCVRHESDALLQDQWDRHTIDRYFELVGYPLNFKKKDNQNVSSNVAVAGNKVNQKPGSSVTHPFTDDQLQKLVALISDKSGSGYVPDVKFYERMFSFKNESENKGYEMVSQDLNNLKKFINFDEDTGSDEPYDYNERVKTTRQSEDTDPSSLGGTKNTSGTKKDDGGHPSTPEEATMKSLAMQIAAKPVFHERTKHFEIELFFLREKVSAGIDVVQILGASSKKPQLLQPNECA